MANTDQTRNLSRGFSRLALVLVFAGFFGVALFSDNFLSMKAQAATLVVTTTADNGNNANPTAGSLRAAIINANNNGSGVIDTITFNIPGGGVHTIKPLSELPTITTQTVIDGYTQPGSSPNTLNVGNNAVLLIEIDGSAIPSNSNAYGIIVKATGCTIKGLVVNNFAGGEAISIDGDEAHVRGNFVGTDPTGTVAKPNDYGVVIDGSLSDVGWTTPADRNLISGNLSFGLSVGGSQNKVFGNYIGTNAAGTQALGNGYDGISVTGTNCTIGNITVTTRNVVSANGNYGIEVKNANNIIQGNYIGVTAAGNVPLGNKDHGISLFGAGGTTIGGASAGAGNVISCNGGDGINAGTSLNQSAQGITIQGNFIGTDTGGTLDLGNTGSGISLRSNLSSVKIGGAQAGESNTIAFNEQGIVAVNNVVSTFSVNKIYSNDKLGIDLYTSFSPDGVTPNDVNDTDGGANGRQNFPVLTSAQNSGGITSITGTLNSTANAQFNIDFYVNTSCDPSGYGEGQTYLGSATATTVGNDVTFSKSFPGFNAGQFVTATATSPGGSTSEFSQCLQVISPAAGTLQLSQASYSVSETAGKATITVARAGGSTGAVSVQYAVTEGSAKSPADFNADSGTLQFANGETSKSFDVMIKDDAIFEGDETINLALSGPMGGAALGNPTTGTLTISDNEQKPSLSISDTVVNEGNSGQTNASFTVTLSGASAQTVSVLYATADGPAQNGAQGGSDYEPASSTLTFNPGETSKTITVAVKGDTDVEPDETFFVNLSSVIGNTATISDGQGACTIKNDDAPAQPTVQLDSANYTVNEGAGSLIVTVTRTGDTSKASVVAFKTEDGNAQQKTDFNIALGTLKFAAGEATKTIQIFITDDAYVEGGETFTLTLSSLANATLGANSSAIVLITDNDNAASANNPVDNAEFFVRQHYVDFLNREPEPQGFKGWQDILKNCAPGDTKCDRIEVSSAFFRSEEFQTRGYFVYRFYEAALGRSPKYLEFMADLRRVTGFLDAQQLEAEKVDFVKDFMGLQEFKQKYDQIQDPAAYVDALSASAGVTLANRDQLVQALQSNQKTRAEVLRAVAESQEVTTKYFNKAFVLMQYFGYLRRDADALYLNWIETLNQTGDYRLMVNGFLNSIEYRQRFNQ